MNHLRIVSRLRSLLSTSSDLPQLMSLLYRCGRDLQQSRAFEQAVTRLLGIDNQCRERSRSRLLMVLRGRLTRERPSEKTQGDDILRGLERAKRTLNPQFLLKGFPPKIQVPGTFTASTPWPHRRAPGAGS
jgi:hypothetical protein